MSDLAWANIVIPALVAALVALLIEYIALTSPTTDKHTEFPGTVRISRESALLALAQFMDTGQRPTCIEWEET